MSNPLKSRVGQTINMPFSPDATLALIRKLLETTWQIESENNHTATIYFVAISEALRLEGLIEPWEGTESRLHLDGKVLLKTPYEAWRDCQG